AREDVVDDALVDVAGDRAALGALEVDLRDLVVLEDGDALLARVDGDEQLALRLRERRPAWRPAARLGLLAGGLAARRALRLDGRLLALRLLARRLGLGGVGGGLGARGGGLARLAAPPAAAAAAAAPRLRRRLAVGVGRGLGLGRCLGGGRGYCIGRGGLGVRGRLVALAATEPGQWQKDSPSVVRARPAASPAERRGARSSS